MIKTPEKIRNTVINTVRLIRFHNFKVMGNSINNYHLPLKESFLNLKLKTSLNIAKESMSSYLFNDDYQYKWECINGLNITTG